MASGSSTRGRGCGSGARGSSSSRSRAAQAPTADAPLLAPPLNPVFVTMNAGDLVAHLSRYRRTDDFVAAALVFGARERRLAELESRLAQLESRLAEKESRLAEKESRLAEAEDHVREGNKRVGTLLDEIRELEYSALEAEAQTIDRAAETEAALRAKIARAAETEAALRAKIARAAETEVALRTKIDRAAETEAALHAKILRAAETEAALQAKILRSAETEAALRGKIRTLQLGAAALLSSCSISDEPVPQDSTAACDDGTTGVQAMFAQREVRGAVPTKTRHGASWTRAAPHLVAAAPLPDKPLIDDDERAAKQVATEILSNNEETQADREVSEDLRLTTRVTAGRCKVSEEEAQAEDMTASPHRRSQGEQAAGHGDEPVHLDIKRASDDDVGSEDAAGVQTMFAQGEVGDDVATKTKHGARWTRAAPHVVAAPLLDKPLIDDDERAAKQVATEVLSNNEEAQGGREISEDVLRARRLEEEAQAAGHDLEPVPLEIIWASDHGGVGFDDERATEQVATEARSSNEEAQGDHQVSQDVLRARVTASRRRKVSEKDAQGEDMAASSHRRSQGEQQQAARATKKARRHKGPSFYNLVLNALKEKEELLIKNEKQAERIAKEAAVAASSKQLCRCWWSAPDMPSKSDAVEEDSYDDSQN